MKLVLIDNLISVKKERSDLVYNTLDFIANEKKKFRWDCTCIQSKKRILRKKGKSNFTKNGNQKNFWGLEGKMEILLLLLERCGFESFQCNDKDKICVGDTVENMNLKISSRFFWVIADNTRKTDLISLLNA